METSPGMKTLRLLRHAKSAWDIPGLTELVNDLTGSHCLDNVPIAGFVELALDIDHWDGLRHGCARFSDHLLPRELPDN